MLTCMNLLRFLAPLALICAFAMPAAALAENPPPAATAPANASAPEVSGTAWVGYPLSCSQGTWTGTDPITYSYTWLVGGYTKSEASSTYTPTTSDRHKTVACRVTASNAAGTASSTSAATAEPVADRPPVFASNVDRPTVLGRALVGQRLTCDIGTWNPGYPTATYSIKWLRGAEILLGESEPTYIVTTHDALFAMSCQAIARNDAGSVTAQSPPSLIVPAPIAKLTIGLLAGQSGLAKPLRRCGRGLSSACKVVQGTPLTAIGALTVRASYIPLVLIVERRTLSGKWRVMSLTKFSSDAGSYRSHLPSSLRKATPGAYRVHVVVTASAKAQKATSPLMYFRLLPAPTAS
jgi:hypothetical protein